MVDQTFVSDQSGTRGTLRSCNGSGLSNGSAAACFVVAAQTGLYGTARDCSPRTIAALEEIGQQLYKDSVAAGNFDSSEMHDELKLRLSQDRRTRDISIADKAQQRNKFIAGWEKIPVKQTSVPLWHARSEVTAALQSILTKEECTSTTFPILLPINPRSSEKSEGGLQLLDIPGVSLPMSMPDTLLGISTTHKRKKEGSQNTLANITDQSRALWTVHQNPSTKIYYASARLQSCSDAQISQFMRAFRSRLGLQADCSAHRHHLPEHREATNQYLMDNVDDLQIIRWWSRGQLERLVKRHAVHIGRMAADALAGEYRQHDPPASLIELACYDGRGELEPRALQVERGEPTRELALASDELPRTCSQTADGVVE